MSRVIILYNYNKYYNRIIKKKSSFQEYLNLITPQGNTPAAYQGFVREKMNFDYQDGVYAQHVLNIQSTDPEIAKSEHPDYCVVEQSWTTGEGENAVTTTKLSRYFILDTTIMRGKQILIQLRRDLLADYYDSVLNAPVFIEKGTVSNVDDPIIFNKESMTVNQIKKGEILLNQTKYSGKGKGWVVGYIAKSEQGQAIGHCEVNIAPPENTINFADLPTILKNAINNSTKVYDMTEKESQMTLLFLDWGWTQYCWRGGLTFDNENNLRRAFLDRINDAMYNNGALLKFTANPLGDSFYAETINNMETDFYNQETEDIPDEIETYFETYYGSANCNHDSTLKSTYNGKYILKDGVLYELYFDTEGYTSYGKEYTASQVNSRSDSLSSKAKDYILYLKNNHGIAENSNATASAWAVAFSCMAPGYDIRLRRATFDTIECDLPATRNENFDAPYDVFCIPCGEIVVKNNTTTVLTTYDDIAIPMARGISIAGTTDKIYDIQLLPYCPENEMIDDDGNIQISGMTEHVDYEYIYKTVNGEDVAVGIILFPKTCKGSFDITLSDNDSIYSRYLKRVISATGVLEKKVKSETDLIRFVSPNFASIFEINAQKNNGIKTLNVDYYYKPYSPYIHVAPYFSGLYGEDFNDPKGLICSGDFSISTAASQWEKYQIENKNYELTFNRQVQNLDVNNAIAYEQAAKQAGLGIVTNTLAGAGAGAAAGGVVGSIIPVVGTALGALVGAGVGAVGGLISSAIGAKYDLEYLQRSQSEARSYAVDMFAYSLGNVQALPYSLTKVTAITPNNKIFPFIEVYDCTSEEKEALINKLFYNGMTIMRIGNIKDYINYYDPTTEKKFRYASGQLIRLVGIEEDSHVVAEIAKEIKEGAYYYGDSE